jgi:hypothetical protein
MEINHMEVYAMITDSGRFKNASVIGVGAVIGGLEGEIPIVCRLGSEEPSVLFVTRTRFVENGNDFWVEISEFGISSREAVGSTSPNLRHRFTMADAESAKHRIVEYFSSEEPKFFFPFNFAKARYAGTKFQDGWVFIKT